MTQVILFDGSFRENLLPLTYTRAVAELRLGILTIREKWQHQWKHPIELSTEAYLRRSAQINENQAYLWIAGNCLPNKEFVEALNALSLNEGFHIKGELIACKFMGSIHNADLTAVQLSAYDKPLIRISYLWDIFSKNQEALEADFDLITAGRVSAKPDEHTKLIGSRFFMEEGSKVSCSIINTTSGAVYIGKNAEVMEGCIIRGATAICEGAQVKMGAKIYGATTVGPGCRAGGEINNSVMQANSNKGHDGFLGNSVLGEWCNLGADTNNSNLKNNYGEVKLYNYAQNKAIGTGLQFCGLIMGDHSKCGINTMFNTGTVVGAYSNIFGAGFPPTHIPSFIWGASENSEVYRADKASETAQRVMSRRNVVFSEDDRHILESVFALSNQLREHWLQ
jgi:UDP-N-acetylglucosamine diphosphorylase/glucosamine-1-phosphate N-acetyltransferase